MQIDYLEKTNKYLLFELLLSYYFNTVWSWIHVETI